MSGYDIKRSDRTVTYAARTVLALVDDDVDSAVRVLTEASTTGGQIGLRDVALALAQFTATRTGPEEAQALAMLTVDRLAAPPRKRWYPGDPEDDPDNPPPPTHPDAWSGEPLPDLDD